MPRAWILLVGVFLLPFTTGIGNSASVSFTQSVARQVGPGVCEIEGEIVHHRIIGDEREIWATFSLTPTCQVVLISSGSREAPPPGNQAQDASTYLYPIARITGRDNAGQSVVEEDAHYVTECSWADSCRNRMVWDDPECYPNGAHRRLACYGSDIPYWTYFTSATLWAQGDFDYYPPYEPYTHWLKASILAGTNGYSNGYFSYGGTWIGEVTITSWSV